MYAADLHIHSKYSRATSADCVPAMLELWARRKGISLLGTGDFTHPAWRQMLREQLTEAEPGLYRLKSECAAPDPFAPPGGEPPRFVVSGEISSIYKQGGRVRKVHNLILLPSLEAADALSARLEAIGNIHSDGRPILGLSSRDLLDVTLNACPDAVFIPAHIWTPHFSLFGAFSGFDAIEECFGDLTPHIHALETGLSSDPAMNWRLSALDRYTLVSNSDAHSPAKLGRELNLIDAPLSYPALKTALESGAPAGFLGTVEFFPEEGKYHFDGHRGCGVCLDPQEAARLNHLCPVCGKRMTMGVSHRVMQLADRPENCPKPVHAAPFERLVPLNELIAAVTGSSPASLRTQARYEALIHALGSELTILRSLPIETIGQAAGTAVAEGIRRMRAGEITLSPGFDGEYGKVQLMTGDEIRALTGQMTFLDALLPEKKQKAPQPVSLPAAEAPIRTVTAAPSAAAGLNDEQRAAAEADEKCIAVAAGPGSGKTKTLIARIAHLIETGVRPAEIAAVTFTNKAAREMRERLARHFGSRRAVQGMVIGTFHSISLALLRRSRPGLTVLDEEAALSVSADLVNGLALNLSPKRFLAEAEKARSGAPSDLDPDTAALFIQRLLSLNAETFDGLLLSELTDPLPPEFTHLLVDEYQDVNEMQRALVRRWNQTGKTLFVIGDADQSIYGFRGADAACFDRLLAERADARLITLRKNYRSAPEILACAIPLIEKNGGTRLIEPGRAPGGCVRRMLIPDEHAEGIAIAKEIARMVGGMDMLDAQTHGEAVRAVGFSDIAVLYRTHRQAEIIEKCLSVEGIPYTVSGREPYLTAPEVVQAIALLRLLAAPWDQAALRALLPGFPLRLPADAELAALLDLLGSNEASAQLADIIRRCAPKGGKDKPRRILERYQKQFPAAHSDAFLQFMNAASAAADLTGFLSNITLGSEGDMDRSGAKAYAPDSVRLMTLHGSKGLEFPVVFIAGLRQGMLPLETPFGRETDLSEERRLFYVGMTRARDQLILMTHPAESMFLRELPADQIITEQPAFQRKPVPGRQLSFL